MKPLYFGPDYLTLNLFKETDGELGKCPLYAQLELLFVQSFNFSNANVYHDFHFMAYPVSFDLNYLDMRSGPAVQFMMQGEPLFLVTKIDKERGQGNLSDYLYRIDFYSTFFNFHRLGLFDYFHFLAEFVHELAEYRVSSSVTRLDLACDLADVSIEKLMKTFVSSLDVSITKINETSGGSETVYVGRKGGKKLVRLYDKLRDSLVKAKKKYFIDYFQYSTVTRVELEVRGEVLKKAFFVLGDVLDTQMLFNLYCHFLQNKYDSFGFVTEVLQFMAENGYPNLKFTLKRNGYKKILSDCEYVKRFLSMADKLQITYGVNPVVLLLTRANLECMGDLEERLLSLAGVIQAK